MEQEAQFSVEWFPSIPPCARPLPPTQFQQLILSLRRGLPSNGTLNLGVEVKGAIECDSRLTVLFQKIGYTALLANWEIDHFDMFFSSGCSVSLPGRLHAVSLLLTGIDEKDEAEAFSLFRSNLAEAEIIIRPLIEAACARMERAPRSLIGTFLVTPDQLDPWLEPCCRALGEAYLGEFGSNIPLPG